MIRRPVWIMARQQLKTRIPPISVVVRIASARTVHGCFPGKSLMFEPSGNKSRDLSGTQGWRGVIAPTIFLPSFLLASGRFL